MTSNINTDAVLAKMDNNIADALQLLGSHITGMVDPPVITGNLKSSIGYVTDRSAGVGGLKQPESKHTLRVGTNVAYAARVEFGFVGTDSLGRTYNQAGKPYLRPVLTHKQEFMDFIKNIIRNNA